MAQLPDWTPEKQVKLDLWRTTKPPVIQAMIAKHPPDRLYRMDTGHRAVIYSYSEDGTVTVMVLGDYNLIEFERRVFGVDPDTLMECDLPEPNEPLGVRITDHQEAIDFARRTIEASKAGRRHEMN